MRNYHRGWSVVLIAVLFVMGGCDGDVTDSVDQTELPKELRVKVNATPDGGKAPLEVDFSATPQFVRGSGEKATIINADIAEKFAESENAELSYEWDFRDDSETREGQTTTHTFSTPGAFDVEVTARLDFAREAKQDLRATGNVVVNVDAPEFTVSVTAEPFEVQVGRAITFSCELETDIAIEAFDFDWSFDEQGLSSSAQETTKSFSTTGTKEATCMVTLGNKMQSASTTFRVQPNPSPEVTAINPQPRSGVAPLDVAFRPTVSYAGDKGELSWQYSFGTGDISTERNPTYTYERGGSYTVTLTVIDPDRDRDSLTTTVKLGTDTQPAVTISQPAQDVTGIEPLNVVFDTQTSGGNRPLQGIEWDFGDGDTTSVDSPTHIFSYRENEDTGEHVVTVMVTDANGDTAQDAVTVTAERDLKVDSVNVAATNQASNNLEGKTVQFTCDVTGGNAPLSFEWAFGDGSTKTTSDKTTAHTYNNADVNGGAPYSTTCRVIDANGDVNSGTSDDIPVIEDTSPAIDSINPSPATASVTSNSTVDVDFSAVVSGGNTPVSYDWTFQDGEPGTTKATNPTVTFDSAGQKTVSLTVTDRFGEITEETMSYRIGSANAPPVAEVRLSSNCGHPEYIVSQTSYSGTEIMIDAAGSRDADGDPLRYSISVFNSDGDEVMSVSDRLSPEVTFTPGGRGEYTVYVDVKDGEGGSDRAKTTLTSSLRHNLQLTSSTVSGKVGTTPNKPVEFTVENECGQPLVGIAVEFLDQGGITAVEDDGADATRNENGTPTDRLDDTFSNVDAYSDINGKVSTLVNLGEDAGDQTLAVETFDNGSSHVNFEEEDFLDQLETTHKGNPGDVANIAMQEPTSAEVSNATQGAGTEVVFQAADRYFNPISSINTAVEFTANLSSPNANQFGFLAPGGASNGTSETITIAQGEDTATERIYSDTVTENDAQDSVYVRVTNVTKTNGDDLPANNTNAAPADEPGSGVALLTLAREDFGDAQFGTALTRSADPSGGDAGGGTYFEIGTPQSGPGSAHSGSKVLATNLSGDYNADWDSWDENANSNSGDDYTETLITRWAFGDTKDFYAYGSHGIHTMDVSFQIYVDTPTGLQAKSDSTFASAVVHYDDDSAGSHFDLASHTSSNYYTNIAYSGLKLWGYLDDQSGNNSTNWTSTDYKSSPVNDADQFIDPEGLFLDDWEDGYAGQGTEFVEQTATFDNGTAPLQNNFTDISRDNLIFGFRVEVDERLGVQPSAAGLYLDSLKVEAVAQAQKVDFTRSNEPGGITFENEDVGFDAIADETVAGWVEYSVQDAFNGDNVGAGTEFTISIDDTVGVGSDARFLHEIAKLSDGEPVGSLVSHSDKEVTVETNDEGKARVYVAGTTAGTVTTDATVTDSNGKTFDSTGNTVELVRCNSTSDSCDMEDLNLFSGDTSGPASGDTDYVRYFEDDSWRAAVDPAGGGDWNDRLSGGALPAADETEVWLYQNNLALGSDNAVQVASRDMYNPDGATGDCSGLGDLDSSDQIFKLEVDPANVDVEFRLHEDADGALGAGTIVGMYVVTDPEEIVDSCVVGAQTTFDGTANGQTVEFLFEPHSDESHYLIVDTDNGNNDIKDVDLNLQTRVDNVEF